MAKKLCRFTFLCCLIFLFIVLSTFYSIDERTVDSLELDPKANYEEIELINESDALHQAEILSTTRKVVESATHLTANTTVVISKPDFEAKPDFKHMTRDEKKNLYYHRRVTVLKKFENFSSCLRNYTQENLSCKYLKQVDRLTGLIIT